MREAFSFLALISIFLPLISARMYSAECPEMKKFSSWTNYVGANYYPLDMALTHDGGIFACSYMDTVLKTTYSYTTYDGSVEWIYIHDLLNTGCESAYDYKGVAFFVTHSTNALMSWKNDAEFSVHMYKISKGGTVLMSKGLKLASTAALEGSVAQLQGAFSPDGNWLYQNVYAVVGGFGVGWEPKVVKIDPSDGTVVWVKGYAGLAGSN